MDFFPDFEVRQILSPIFSTKKKDHCHHHSTMIPRTHPAESSFRAFTALPRHRLRHRLRAAAVNPGGGRSAKQLTGDGRAGGGEKILRWIYIK